LTREIGPEPASPERHLSPQEMARFTEGVLPYLDAAYNLARYLLRDPHEAEDAVQEAFLRAIRHFDGFRGGDGRAWLLSIVRNACFTLLRRRRSGGDKVEFDEAIHSPEREGSGPEADLESALAADSVRAGLDRLGAEFREVIVLREMEGLSYKEIAQVAGVPIGTVMSRLARARRQLMVALAGATKEND
jgi:RNA polymerase sigma-70 factor (ECF subfamily)